MRPISRKNFNRYRLHFATVKSYHKRAPSRSNAIAEAKTEDEGGGDRIKEVVVQKFNRSPGDCKRAARGAAKVLDRDPQAASFSPHGRGEIYTVGHGDNPRSEGRRGLYFDRMRSFRACAFRFQTHQVFAGTHPVRQTGIHLARPGFQHRREIATRLFVFSKPHMEIGKACRVGHAVHPETYGSPRTSTWDAGLHSARRRHRPYPGRPAVSRRGANRLPKRRQHILRFEAGESDQRKLLLPRELLHLTRVEMTPCPGRGLFECF